MAVHLRVLGQLLMFYFETGAQETNAAQQLQDDRKKTGVIHWLRQLNVPHVTAALDNVVFAGAAMKPSVRSAHTQIIHAVGPRKVSHVRTGLCDMHNREFLDLLRGVQSKVHTSDFSDAHDTL